MAGFDLFLPGAGLFSFPAIPGLRPVTDRRGVNACVPWGAAKARAASGISPAASRWRDRRRAAIPVAVD
jgi:hypothetical protein